MLSKPRKRAANSVGGACHSSAGVADCVELAVAHQRDAVADRQRLLLVVGDVDDRQSQPLEELRPGRRAAACAASDPARPSGSSSISSRGVGASARARATRCCSPPGQLGHGRRCVAGQADQLEDLRNARSIAARRHVAHAQAEGHVAARRRAAERAGSPGTSGRNCARAAACRRRSCTGPAHPPGAERLEPGDGAQQRRLARAARAEQGQALSRPRRSGSRRRRPAIEPEAHRHLRRARALTGPPTRRQPRSRSTRATTVAVTSHQQHGHRHRLAEGERARLAEQAEDRDRHRRRIGADDEQRRAELAQRHREGEGGADSTARPMIGRSTSRHARPRRGAEHRRGLAQAIVDRAQDRHRWRGQAAAGRRARGRSGSAAARRAGRSAGWSERDQEAEADDHGRGAQRQHQQRVKAACQASRGRQAMTDAASMPSGTRDRRGDQREERASCAPPRAAARTAPRWPVG